MTLPKTGFLARLCTQLSYWVMGKKPRQQRIWLEKPHNPSHTAMWVSDSLQGF